MFFTFSSLVFLALSLGLLPTCEYSHDLIANKSAPLTSWGIVISVCERAFSLIWWKIDSGRQYWRLVAGSESLLHLSWRWIGRILRPRPSVMGSGLWFSRKVETTFEMAASTVLPRRVRLVVLSNRLFCTSHENAHIISPRFCAVKWVRNGSAMSHLLRKSFHLLKWPVCFFLVVFATPL